MDIKKAQSQAAWLEGMIRIDTGTNGVINRFQKADLLQRAEMCDIPALTLAVLQ